MQVPPRPEILRAPMSVISRHTTFGPSRDVSLRLLIKLVRMSTHGLKFHEIAQLDLIAQAFRFVVPQTRWDHHSRNR